MTKYVFLYNGQYTHKPAVERAEEVDTKATHPDYLTLKFPDLPGQPILTCHKAGVFDNKKDALLHAVTETDDRIKGKLEDIKDDQYDLERLINARIELMNQYAACSKE